MIDPRDISRDELRFMTSLLHTIPRQSKLRNARGNQRGKARGIARHSGCWDRCELSRGGDVLKLPSSRKVRALLGYLVLASRPVARSQVCELLWDVPNDPRGELRWCLSKIRGLIDEKGRKRVIADGNTIRLDLTDCIVDTLEVTRAPEHGIQKLGVERQQELGGAVRRRVARRPRDRAQPDVRCVDHRRAAALSRHPDRAAREPRARAAARGRGPYIDEWLKLSPFDRNAHELLLGSLARQGRIADGEAHLASACKLFEADGLDSAPLRDLWRTRARNGRRSRRSPGPTLELVSASLTEIRRLRARRARGHAPRVHRRHAVRRSLVRSRQARRRGRRAGLRRHHAAGEAAQHVRDRAGHHVRAARSRHRARRSRAHAQRRLRGQRLGAAQCAANSP